MCACSSTDVDRAIFEDVSEKAGLSLVRHHSGATGNKWFPETMGAGVGFIDYDNDGWEDILVVNGGKWGPDNDISAVSLIRNMQNGSFQDVSDETGLSDVYGYGFGLAVGDYDNDGDSDFIVTTLEQNLFFENEGNQFKEVGSTIGIADESEWSTAVLFLDGDGDGWLDVLVGNYVEWSPETDRWCTIDTKTKEYCTPEAYEGLPLRYYRNQQDGTFEEYTASAGLDVPVGKTLGITLLDYNNDDLIDLAVANDTERDLLFENQGDGTFREIGIQKGIALSRAGKATAGMGIDAGMIDKSSQPALVIGNFSKETFGVFQYSPTGMFRDRAAATKLSSPSLLSNTFGLFLFDVDLDSDLDIFAYNGHVHEGVSLVQEGIQYAQLPQLFMNDGSGQFVPDEKIGAISGSMVGRGAAYGDYDNDGDLDVLLSENNGPVRLWENRSRANNAVQLHLRGTATNASAIGAQVIAYSAGMSQRKWVRSGGSYLSASTQLLTFGTGEGTSVDSVVIIWPVGSIQKLTDVPVASRLLITENVPGYTLAPTNSDSSLR